MVDLSKTIEPKSDQINYDDFLGGITKTITVTKVVGSDGDQPIAIRYEGDNGKPYKPCKSMRRVLVALWGANGAEYAGKSMTLYGDPEVMFGGVKVGGIRISHVSHITEPHVLSLTAKKGGRKPFTVRPLTSAPATTQAAPTITPEEIETLKSEGMEIADAGMDPLKTWWTGLGAAKQKAIGGAVYLDELKKIAGKNE